MEFRFIPVAKIVFLCKKTKYGGRFSSLWGCLRGRKGDMGLFEGLIHAGCHTAGACRKARRCRLFRILSAPCSVKDWSVSYSFMPPVVRLVGRRFGAGCVGLYNALIHNVLQKAMFRALKDGLLGCKRRSFGRRKVPFQNMKGGFLMIRVPPFSSKLILSCFQLVGFMPRRRPRARL